MRIPTRARRSPVPSLIGATVALFAAVISMALGPPPASAASTSYAGTIGGILDQTIDFRVVSRRVNGKTVRTIKGVTVEKLPVFCDDGQATNSNGSILAEPRVRGDRRFAATSYSESGSGSINLSHFRGEFSRNRAFASGRIAVTTRFVGGKECASGFHDWSVDRVDPNRR